MKSRLRLLFTTAEQHPTHRPDVRVLFGKYLPQAGIESTLVAIAEPGQPAPWGGGPVLLRGARGKIGRLLADTLLDASLVWRAGQGFDAVVVRDKPILGILGLLAARVARIPFIYWMSFPMPELYLAASSGGSGETSVSRRLYSSLRGRLGHLLLYRWMMHSADHLFVQSDAMLEHLRGLGLGHDRVTPVPMGVDMEDVPSATPLLLPELEGSEIAVYLGTLDRSRRLDVIVEAAKLVSTRRPRFRLLVVGAAEIPKDQGWIERYVRDNGAQDIVVFTGRVPYERGLALARSAKVGLSPIPRNAMFDLASPTKPVEYLGIGLPVVCNDQPDQARVVRDSGGGLCVPLEPQAFASAIEQLLENPEMAARMAATGLRYVAAHRSYRMIAGTVADRIFATCGSSVLSRQGGSGGG